MDGGHADHFTFTGDHLPGWNNHQRLFRMRYVPEKCMLQSDRAEAGMILGSKSDITNAAETAREDELLADKVGSILWFARPTAS